MMIIVIIDIDIDADIDIDIDTDIIMLIVIILDFVDLIILVTILIRVKVEESWKDQLDFSIDAEQGCLVRYSDDTQILEGKKISSGEVGVWKEWIEWIEIKFMYGNPAESRNSLRNSAKHYAARGISSAKEENPNLLPLLPPSLNPKSYSYRNTLIP